MTSSRSWSDELIVKRCVQRCSGGSWKEWRNNHINISFMEILQTSLSLSEFLWDKWWRRADKDDVGKKFSKVLTTFSDIIKEKIRRNHNLKLASWEMASEENIPDFSMIFNARIEWERGNLSSIGWQYIYFRFDGSKQNGIKVIRIPKSKKMQHVPWISADISQAIWTRVYRTVLDPNQSQYPAMFVTSWLSDVWIKDMIKK